MEVVVLSHSRGDIREPISFRMKRNDKEILDLEKISKNRYSFN